MVGELESKNGPKVWVLSTRPGFTEIRELPDMPGLSPSAKWSLTYPFDKGVCPLYKTVLVCSGFCGLLRLVC